jgi:hypothetical protein
VNRCVGNDEHCWTARKGDWVSYEFASPTKLRKASLVLDSSLDKYVTFFHRGLRKGQVYGVPPTMPKAFTIQGKNGKGWETIARVEDNHQRAVRVPIDQELTGVRFILDRTWGSEESRVLSFCVD